MKTITTIKEMQAITAALKKKNTLGYVPTMGYLHEGHIQLIREARKANDIVVVSIFVNPLQFGPNEDFDSYPRDFERDGRICIEEGVDYIFYPSVEEMYPSPLSVKVLVQERTNVLCGESRPGHFDGVATVLTKLFHIIAPERVYMGMKDAQQVAVVSGLISDFHFPIELIPVATVREEDGLAKSSRNVHLSPEEREQAPILYQSLLQAKELTEAGETNPNAIISRMRNLIETKTSGTIDYIEIYSFPELRPIEKLEGKIIVALAVKFSKARLIDNLVLTVE
ncbi:pantoate--beta-alanine ligase [Robertmurraya andreesenii]|uniref:Pantothenate synthetase n=1 Tax=Anoxybacillus andreesenii TaxID=1325932 RepID=A0ABT9V2M9_9BACL|nr:pantoate--beta-alanine ligase [Robertmurraya andreesenii]MDQ0155194.1 pantoate--beta-alanine ligase [Robertmurraya andreesenii]